MLNIDESISQTLSQVFNSVFTCFGALTAISIGTNGTFLVLLVNIQSFFVSYMLSFSCNYMQVPLAVVYYKIQDYFRKTNTTVARLTSVSMSPIYADFSQALVGVNTIRAYKDEERFINNLEISLDRNTIASITSQLVGILI
jgi:ABC-type multidrug transport system fused ATPase/permease subunit